MKKKTLLFGALFALMSPIFAQHYKIKGKANQNTKKVYLYNLSSEKPDSVLVGKKGFFVFEGDAKGNLLAVLVDKTAKKNLNVILDGVISADLITEKVSGTIENNKLQEWSEKKNQLEENLNKVYQKFVKAKEENKTAEADSLYSIVKGQYSNLCAEGIEMCKKNTDFIFPAYFVMDMANAIPKEELVNFYDHNVKFLNIGLTKPLKALIEKWKKSMPGALFADVEEPDTSGVNRKLSDYVGKGNYVLIDFWASWCGPCMAEMPNVKALYDKYHDKGFDVVGLSFDNNKKSWLAAIKRLGLKWHHLSDLKGWKTKAGEVYGVHSIPYTVLVGPDGKIISTDLRGEELAEKLAKIYGN